jgi:PAS domain S-box-containing protein
MELLNHLSGSNKGPFVVITDIHATIVFVNQAFASRFAVGKRMADLMTPADQLVFARIVKELTDQSPAAPLSLTASLYTQTKEIVPVQLELSIIPGAEQHQRMLLFTGIEIAESEKINLQSIIDSTDVTYILLDTQLNIVAFNAIARERSKLFFNEEIEAGKHFLSPTPEHRRGAALSIMEDVLKGKEREYESEYFLPDGSSRNFYIRINPLTNDEKQITGLCFAATDITATKSTERELKTSYDRLSSLINNTPLAIIEYDRDMVVTKWNDQAEKIFGWKASDAIGRKINDDIVYEHDWHIVHKEIARLNRDRSQQMASENRNITRDGKIIHCQWYNSVLRDAEGNVAAYLSLVNDISNQKTTETALREREEQLRLFIEHSPAALAMFDTDMRYLVISRRWLTDYQLGNIDIIGKTHYEVFPNITQEWKDIHQRCLRGAVETNDEDAFMRIDGSIDYVKWEVRPWYKGSGEIGGIIMFTEVITEQKEAEIKFRNLAEKSLVGIYIIQNGRYAYVNPKFAEIFGYTREELTNTVPVDMVVLEEDRPRVLQNISDRMEGNAESFSYEVRGKKKNGQQIWMEVFGNRTQYKGNTAIIGTLLDITTRKLAQEEKERTSHQLNERIKEVTVLYRAHTLLQSETLSVKDVLTEIVTLLPCGWQYPEITAAQITFGDIVCSSPNYAKGVHSQHASFTTSGDIAGKVEVVYLEKRPEEEEGAFLKEERNLINVIAEMLRIYFDRRQTTEALMKSEANLHTILETTDTAYILFNRDLKIISYNTRANTFVEKMLKETPDMNHSLFDYLLDDKRENLKRLIPEVLNGKTISYESNYPQKDGTQNWYHIRIYPVTNPENKVFSIMMAISDISDRKANERTLVTHMKLLEELSFVTSHELRHEYAKVQSAINFLKDIKSPETEQSMVIEEIERSFNNINKLIYKLNDKITFNQGNTSGVQGQVQFKRIEKVLLIDDDPMINFLNERILNAVLKGSKQIVNFTGVDEALDYLSQEDQKGNHLIFLDLNMPDRSGWDFLDAYRNFKVQSPVMILTSSIDPADMERSKKYPQVKKFLTKPLPVKFVKTLFTNE